MHSTTVLTILFSFFSLTSALVVPTPRQGAAADIIKRNQVKRADIKKRTICIPGTPLEIFCGGDGGNGGGGSHPDPPKPSNYPTCELNGKTCPFDEGYKCNSHGQCVKRCQETGTIWDLFNKNCKCDIGFLHLDKSDSGIHHKRTFTLNCQPYIEKCGGHFFELFNDECRCQSGYDLVSHKCLPKCQNGQIRHGESCVDACQRTNIEHCGQSSSGGCELGYLGNCRAHPDIPCASGLHCGTLGLCTHLL